MFNACTHVQYTLESTVLYMMFVDISNPGFEWDDHGFDTSFIEDFYSSLGKLIFVHYIFF